ncbi:MAG: hypothetical protein H6819_06135 [Phycisphaerales bacterium]|nr:hypothetical protein [Phycisphaerales bacterium]MCB9858601.1 hypothetical protein [Phycisphaerales bacterium]
MKPSDRLNPSIPPSNGREAGERRKRDALELHEVNRDDVLSRGRRALLEILLRSDVATADDVRDAITLPPGIDARCLGSIPGPLAKAGIIECSGYVKSSRPARHASILTVWRLVDGSAARRWLAMNPAPPDDDDAAAGMVQADPPKKPSPTAATVGLGVEGH